MPIGVSLQLFNGLTPQASLSGIQALWWDVTEPKDAGAPIGKSVVVTTDASGYISLDLSDVTGLTVGDFGFLSLYKLDGGDHQDSLVFSGKVQTSTVGSGVVLQSTASTWVRDPSWTAMPDLTGLQKFAGLHAVYPNSNFCALSATGNFTVDWGDGVVENIASGVTVYHQFDFADADLAGTNAPVTLQDAGDTITRTAHGYTNGMKVVLHNLVSTTGVVEGQTYFVVGATANTFQVSATLGGSALALTTDGTATLLPYKLAMVTVVPNGGGVNLTSLNLHLKHNQSLLQTYSSGFLDIAIRAPLMTDLRIGDSAPGAYTQNIRFADLQQINIIASDLRQCQSLLSDAFSLMNVVNFATSTTAASTVACTFQDTGDTVTATAHGRINGDQVIFATIVTTTGIFVRASYFVVGATANTFQVSTTYGGTAVALTGNGSGTVVMGTNFNGVFNNCYSLQTIPLINTAAVVDFSYTFNNCYALQTIPLINTAAVTSFNSTFNSCNTLQTIPLLNTAAGNDFSYMFAVCYALQTIPLLNTAAGLNFNGTFNSCYALQTIPLLNTAAGLNFSGMFENCYSLQTIPLLNTAAGLNFGIMFNNCYSLQTIPLLNTASGTSFNGMFARCYSLQTIPLINTAAGLNFGSMFASCSSLQAVPALNTAAGTGFGNMFGTCQQLAQSKILNPKVSHSYSGCKLSATALNEIYTNLFSPVTSQTITVSNNWGTASDTPSIATAKGWTVTG